MNPALSLPNALSAPPPGHDAARRRVVLLMAVTASAGLAAIGAA